MNLLQRLTTVKKTEMQAQSEQTAAASRPFVRTPMIRSLRN